MKKINTNGYAINYKPKNWESGILLGNGTLGAIDFGGGATTKYALTHEKVFAPMYDLVSKTPNMFKYLPEIRKLIFDQKYKQAAQVLDKVKLEAQGNNELLWPNSFMPAAQIEIEQLILEKNKSSKTLNETNYSRNLDFINGVSTVNYNVNSNLVTRKSFISHSDNIGVINITTSEICNFKISLNEFDEKVDTTKILKNFENIEFFQLPNAISFKRKYKTRKDEFYLASLIINSNTSGVLLKKLNKNTIIIENTKDFVIKFCITKQDEPQNLLENLNFASVIELEKAHSKKHKKLMEQTKLSIVKSENNSVNANLLNTIFNSCQYLILGSTGKWMPNLQGIWTGTHIVNWSSDYTNNGNVQTAIQNYLQWGNFSGMLSLFDYLENFIKQYKINAKNLYGSNGIFVPPRSSDSGAFFHYCVDYPMLYWYSGAGWFAHFYYDYWQFSGHNNEFFIKRALPFFKKIATFYKDFLIEGSDGKWIFAPSYSPENTPSNSDSPVAINATMDIAIAKELFNNIITGCSTLNIEKELINECIEILRKMPNYLINNDGALKEWSTELLNDNYDHRHSSHLYMLYYDLPYEFEVEKPYLLKAARKAYQIKLQKRVNEGLGSMAFGLIQQGMAAIRLKDTFMLDKIIEQLVNNNFYDSFATSHDAGPEIFNTDIAGGLPSMLLEAICYSSPQFEKNGKIKNYKIRLLPALPKAMQSGNIKSLHLRGGFIINITWENGKITKYDIKNNSLFDYILEKY